MNKNRFNRFKIVSLFLLVILINLSFYDSVSAGGDIIIIEDGTDLSSTNNENRIVMDSNANYWFIQLDGNSNKYELFESTDSGDTWNMITSFNQGSGLEHILNIAIDSEDVIHILYCDTQGGSFLYYRSYNIDTDTLSSQLQIDSEVNHPGILNADMTVDYNDNVYIAWNNDDDNEISFMYYTHDLETWSSELTADFDATDDFRGISMDCSNNAVWISYIQMDSTNGNDLMLCKYSLVTESFGEKKIQDLTIDSSEVFTDIAVKDTNINIVYCYNHTDGDLGVNYTYDTVTSTTFSNDESIYFADGYDQLNPSISISNDDVIHIVWDGNNVALGGRDGTVGKRGEYGNWSEIIYYAWDSADSVQYSNIYYQNYPSNLNGETGIIGVCDNITEHQSLFFDYGIMLTDVFDTEYSYCESDYVRVEFLDGDVMDYNNNYRIRILTSVWSGEKYYRIRNATGVTVQTHDFYDSDETIFFEPKNEWGNGTFDIQVKSWLWSWTDERIDVCTFTVQNGTTVHGNWSIWTDKTTYNVDEDPKLFYIIPSGDVGRIKIYNKQNTLVYDSQNILGVGVVKSKIGFLTLTANQTYTAYLLNSTTEDIVDFKEFKTTSINETETPIGVTDTSWFGLPWWTPLIIGIFITLFVTVSPLILATYITRKTRINKINIPDLLYVGFFFMGLIISVAIGFLPIWLPFVILFGMVTFFAVQWLYGKRTVEGE